MLEHSTTVRAETVDKAIEKGLRELNISRSQADVHVISEGKKGLFGFGKQDAIVEITAKNDLTLSEITKQLEEEQKMEDTESVNLSKEPVEVSNEVETEEVEEVLVVEEVKMTPEVTEIPVEEVHTEEEDINGFEAEVEESLDYNKDIDKEDDEDESDFDAEDAPDKMSIEEASAKVATYIQAVIKEYGANADVVYEISRSQVMFNIDTDKSGLVIGKHGKIINSLQILSQTYFQSMFRRRTSILLNVGDYRDRRANVLEQIAQRTADEVLRTKQAVILDPLPAYERKQIHAHLARIDHIKTHSEGKEPNRYLVVEFKN